MNVSQWSHEEEPFRRMVRTRIDRLAWDHWLSLNPHPLTIYLEFVPTHGAALERRMSMWRWRCSSSWSNLGSRWRPLSLATRPNQPPSHGASNRILSLHHLSHFWFSAIMIYSP
jgi:hypothetical protein